MTTGLDYRAIVEARGTFLFIRGWEDEPGLVAQAETQRWAPPDAVARPG